MRSAWCHFVLSATLVLVLFNTVRGDVFVLSSGERVMGELLNPDQSPREEYVVRTTSGIKVTLTREQVKRVIRQRPVELEYEKIQAKIVDTVEGHWEMAEWCREHRLNAQRQKHLERVVELEPNHVKARRGLGHSQVNGRWTSQKEAMLKDGRRYYKGRWRLTQEIELIERKRAQNTAEKEWFKKLKRWSGWLGDDKSSQAIKNIRTIKDPVAIKALTAAIKEDRRRDAQALYAEALALIATPEAMKVLAMRSIEDPDEEVRLTCLDYLKKDCHPDIVTYYAGKLKDKDNRLVNRAAVALREVNAHTAVGALIDALVTIHKYKIVKGKPGGMSSTFGNGGSGFSAGSSATIVKQHISNQPVLDALVSLTGLNFNFDQKAWKAWYASQRKRDALDTRRNR